MRDRIYLDNYVRDLEVGAFGEEYGKTQKLRFEVSLELTPQDYMHDDADCVLSYDVILQAIDAALALRRYRLLEALAQEILTYLFSYTAVQSASIKIEKLGRIAGALGTELERTRQDMQGEIDPVKTPHTPPMLVIVDVQSGPDAAHYRNLFDHLAVDTAYSKVLVPLPDMAPDLANLPQIRRYFLELDQRAWTLAQITDLPVVDTRTEALAFLAHGADFIRAYGRQILDDPLPLDVFDQKTLIRWHKTFLLPQETLTLS